MTRCHIFASLAFAATCAAANMPTLTDTVNPLPGPACFSPGTLSINQTTKRIYTAESGDAGQFGANGRLSIIDPQTNSVLKNLSFQWSVAVTCINENTNTVYLSTYSGPDGSHLTPSTILLDGATNQIKSQVSGNISAGVIDTATGRIFVPVDYTVSVYDGATLNKIQDIALSYRSNSRLAINPATRKVYAPCYAGNFPNPTGVTVIDADSFASTLVKTGGEGNIGAVTIDTALNRVFVAGTTPNGSNGQVPAIYVLEGSAIVATIPLTSDDFDLVYASGLSGAAVDAAQHRAYFSVSGYPTHRSIVIDTQNNKRLADLPEYFADGAVLKGASKLYFTQVTTSGVSSLRKENSIGTIDLRSSALKKIVTGYRPFAVEANTRTGRLYMADQQAGEMLVFNAADHSLVARVAVGASNTSVLSNDNGSRDVAVSEKLNRIYLQRNTEAPANSAGYGDSVVDVVDGASNSLVTSITLAAGDYNHGFVAVDDTRGQLYATVAPYVLGVGSQPALLVLKLSDYSVVANIPLKYAANAVAANPVTGRVYVSVGSGDSSVAIIDGNTNKLVKSVSAGALPGQIRIDRKRNRVYVANLGAGSVDNSVTVIDGASDTTVTTFSNTHSNNGDAVAGVAVDDVSNTVYVADNSNQFDATGRLTVFDPANNYTFLGQIELGNYPGRMAFDPATRDLWVTNNNSGYLSVLHDSTPRPPDLLGNISTRTRVAGGDNVLIGGFIVTGPQGATKTVLVRAIGPALTASGVPGALSDTVLELHDSAGNVVINDDWKAGGTINQQPYASDQARIQATGVAPTFDKESAIIATVPTGPVTAIVTGKGAATGVALVEVYDIDQGSAAQLANISTRGKVETGNNVMIGGIIVLGATPQNVVVRALGPSLSGVQNTLQDPTVELRDPNGVLIVSNDDWQTRDSDKSSQTAEINATGIPPADPRESALLATLYPNVYTAIVRGKGDAAGVALIEVYNTH